MLKNMPDTYSTLKQYFLWFMLGHMIVMSTSK